MTSEITDFDNHSSIVSSNLQKNTPMSGTSKVALVAFVVTGVAGTVIVALGFINTFGSVGSTGFIISVVVGGACTCLAIGGIIWIALINCKKQKAAETKEISVRNDIVTTNTTDPTNSDIDPKKMPEEAEQQTSDSERSTQNSPTTITQQSTDEEESIQFPSSIPPAKFNPLTPMQTKLVATVDQELEKQRILEVYGQQMVEALGGAEKIMGFPFLDEPPEDIRTFPAGHFVRGESDSGPFLSFCYKTYDENLKSYSYPKHECWTRDKKAKTWSIVQIGNSDLLSPKANLKLVDDSIATKFLIDRIRRLASGEPIGLLDSRSRSEQLLLGQYIPNNAYLKNVELAEYMKFGIPYEKDPNEYSEIISWDPKQSNEFNRARLKREHPHQKLMS